MSTSPAPNPAAETATTGRDRGGPARAMWRRPSWQKKMAKRRSSPHSKTPPPRFPFLITHKEARAECQAVPDEDTPPSINGAIGALGEPWPPLDPDTWAALLGLAPPSANGEKPPCQRPPEGRPQKTQKNTKN